MAREEMMNQIERLFTNEDIKSKDLTFIVYPNRVSSLLVSLPLDIARENRKKNIRRIYERQQEALQNDTHIRHRDLENQKEESLRYLPNYLFASERMNLFNYIGDKNVRISNNFCKMWIWTKDNEKIIRDFIKIISRHRICEGFELVHT